MINEIADDFKKKKQKKTDYNNKIKRIKTIC